MKAHPNTHTYTHNTSFGSVPVLATDHNVTLLVEDHNHRNHLGKICFVSMEWSSSFPIDVVEYVWLCRLGNALLRVVKL